MELLPIVRIGIVVDFGHAPQGRAPGIGLLLQFNYRNYDFLR